MVMNLVELDRGVIAFTDPNPRFGRSNVGLVIDADGLTVFDTTATPTNGAAVHRSIVELTAELELQLKRVVLSSSRIPFSGGGQPFWAAGFYGTEVTSDQLDAPPNHDAFRRLLPEHAVSYGNDFVTRPITHTVSEPAWLTPAALALPLPGESAANLVLQLPAANVVFAGALGSFGVTPLLHDGYPTAWIESLQHLSELGSIVLPGHGPPGGPADIADLIGYLEAIIAADGAVERMAPGPWDTWTDRRFDPINIERASALERGIDEVPVALLQMLGFS